MIKLYFFMEAIVLLTIYLIITRTCKAIYNYLKLVGDSSNFYSRNKLHIWQGNKAIKAYNKELDEKIKEARK